MKAKIVLVQANQSLIDIAIKEYQSVEGAFLIMLTNKDVVPNVTAVLNPGTPLTIWPLKTVKEVAERTESIRPYLPIIMQWIMSSGGTSGGGSGGLNDGDYVHIRGDESVFGEKSFHDKVKANTIEEIGNEGLMIEDIFFKDGKLDLGTF